MYFVPVPVEYCFRRETISHATHPHLFPAPLLELEATPSIPRLRRGHDVSGHIFLLTLSVLFLGDQIRQSLAFKRYWNVVHETAIVASGALSALWLFSLWVTSVYFHTAYEKYTGLGKSQPISELPRTLILVQRSVSLALLYRRSPSGSYRPNSLPLQP